MYCEIYSFGLFYVLDYSGSFDMHIGKRKKTYFFHTQKTGFAVRGGGLRNLRTGPQLIVFLRLSLAVSSLLKLNDEKLSTISDDTKDVDEVFSISTTLCLDMLFAAVCRSKIYCDVCYMPQYVADLVYWEVNPYKKVATVASFCVHSWIKVR